MRQIMLLIFGLMMSVSLFASADDKKQNQDPISVELEKGSVTNDDTHPRTLIPIVCVYVDGMVQLTFLDNLGDFTLTVTNQSTGEQWSAENIWTLPTSTASGIYWVEIETGDGSTYYGSYTL